MKTPSHIKIKKFVMELCFKHPEREEKIPTEIELCKIFNVTRPTVRKALKGLVSEKILIIKRGAGTFTNPAKLSCGERYGNRTKLVGIIIHSGKEIIMPSYMSEIISGITLGCSSGGASVRIINLNEISEKTDSEIMSLNIDCLIWANPTADVIPVIKKLAKRNVSVTVLNIDPALLENHNADIVLYDPEHEGALISDYFASRGHQKILFISKDKFRFESFRKALASKGISYNEKLHVIPTNNLMDDLLRRIELGVEFTGIYAHGYYIDDVISVLNKEVPEYKEKYKILGNDFSMRGKDLLSGFDRISLPLFEVGKTGAELALKRVQAPATPAQIIKLKPILIRV